MAKLFQRWYSSHLRDRESRCLTLQYNVFSFPKQRRKAIWATACRNAYSRKESPRTQLTIYMGVLRIQLPAFDARRILVAPQLGNDSLEKGMPLKKGKALVVAKEAGCAWRKRAQGHGYAPLHYDGPSDYNRDGNFGKLIPNCKMSISIGLLSPSHKPLDPN